MNNKQNIPAIITKKRTSVPGLLLSRVVHVMVLILICNSLIAAQEQIVFQVHMEYAHLNPGDRVLVRGGSTDLGNWTESTGLELVPSVENEAIFTGSIPANTVPETGLEYKFVIQPAEGELLWEHRANRIIKPEEQPELVWFDDRTSPGIRQTILTLTIRLDLSDYSLNGSPVEGVQLMGGRAPLTFDEEQGGREMNQVSEQVWETSVGIPYGTPKDIPFKFRWKYLDEWHWEYRPGHINHVVWLDDIDNREFIELVFDHEQGGIIPSNQYSDKVDNYSGILRNLGAEAAGSRYHYEEAIAHLMEGKLAQARKSYNEYIAGTSSKSEIDDFQYIMAGKIAEERGMDVAQTYIDQEKQFETNQNRKAHFEYLKGELLLKEGRGTEARAHFNKVRNEFPQEEEITDYSENGLIVSYLMEGDSVSLGEAKALLEPYMESGHKGRLTQLARLYGMLDDHYKQREVLVKLTQTGNAKQRTRSLLKLASFDLQNEDFEQSLSLLNALPQGTTQQQQKEWQALKIDVLTKLGKREQLVEEVAAFERSWPNDTRLKQFNKDKKRAEEKIKSKKALKAAAQEGGEQ